SSQVPTKPSKDGCTEDPDLSILIPDDQPAQPFARFLGAALPVENGHMFATADDAQRVDLFGKASRQFAVGKLVARNDLVYGSRQGTGKVLRELSVLALIGSFDELTPQGIGRGHNLLVGFLDD